MARRTVAGLLAALALLVAPATASAVASPTAVDTHSAARVTVVDHHATVVHVVAPATKRERRSLHHAASSPALVEGAVGVAPSAAWADLATPVSGYAADTHTSARPRAPPAVV